MLLILILGFVSLVYWFILMIFTSTDMFNNIWLLFSFIFFFTYYLTKQYLKNPKRNSLSLVVPIYVCLILGIFIIIITSFIILANVNYKAESDLDYIIVLGSKLDDKELATNTLKKRLDKAKEYLDNNDSTILVLSGGITEGKSISEAEVMAAYLLNQGIESDRILVEIQSHNTRENIIYSFALIQKQLETKRQENLSGNITVRGPVLNAINKPQRIGVLTSDFHTFRAMTLARSLESTYLYSISADSSFITLPNMYLRECLAILKEKFMGYI